MWLILSQSKLVWCNLTAKAYTLLGLLWHTFGFCFYKKWLYLILVESQLVYCSPIRTPQYIKDIILVETIPQPTTKLILNDTKLDYTSLLLTINLSTLMYLLKLLDIVVLDIGLRNLHDDLIYFIVSFSSTTTRSLIILINTHKSRTNIAHLSISIVYRDYGILFFLL